MRDLTDKQQAILDFIETFHCRENVPPTVYEIAENFDIKPATSFAHIRALMRKGYLNRTSKARSITLLQSHMTPNYKPHMTIPVLGKISAGLPLLSAENVDEMVCIDPTMLRREYNSGSLFALRIKGDSMKDAGILDGDMVIAVQKEAKKGDIVIALIEDESTIKYLYFRDDLIELRPANPAYKPQLYPARSVQIQGVMTGLIRTL